MPVKGPLLVTRCKYCHWLMESSCVLSLILSPDSALPLLCGLRATNQLSQLCYKCSVYLKIWRLRYLHRPTAQGWRSIRNKHTLKHLRISFTICLPACDLYFGVCYEQAMCLMLNEATNYTSNMLWLQYDGRRREDLFPFYEFWFKWSLSVIGGFQSHRPLLASIMFYHASHSPDDARYVESHESR